MHRNQRSIDSASRHRTDPARRSIPRAVVIEDDPDIRALHRQVLEPLGLEVVMTTNATDGIEAVREFNPEITFLDVNMPGMDGFAAAARIREASDTHVLMITALDDEIDVVQGLGSGADDYVLKPFRPRELRARVEAVLRRRQALRATVAPVSPVNPVHPVPRELEPDLWSASAARNVRAVESPVQQAQTLHERAPETRPLAPRPLPAAAPDSPVGDVVTRGATALAVVPPRESLPRHAGVTDRPEQQPGEWLQHGSLALHPETHVAMVEGSQVELDPQESALLATLISSGQRIRSVANLVLALRGEGYVTTYFVNDADKHAVVDHVDSLRRKLGDTGPTPLWIEPVRAVGFRMTSA